jgi:hypothetical protein
VGRGMKGGMRRGGYKKRACCGGGDPVEGQASMTGKGSAGEANCSPVATSSCLGLLPCPCLFVYLFVCL